MKKQEKYILNQCRYIKRILLSVVRGATSVPQHTSYSIIMLIYALIVAMLIYFKNNIWNTINDTLLLPIPTFFLNILFWIMVIIVTSIILYSFSEPLVNAKFERGFKRVGMCNKADEVPFVRKMRQDKERNLWVIDFDSTGIPIEYWRDKEEEIETALNVYIYDIKAGCNRNRVTLECVPAKGALSNFEPWNKAYISTLDFEIAIGKSAIGVEYANLDITSHALIAGSTGSGKTMELKCILYQCLKKNAVVYLVDFKGGANFSKKFKEHLLFAWDLTAFFYTLEHVLSVLEYRKNLFATNGCENINEYNKTTIDKLLRIVIAIDELAECFDKSGLSKEEKQKIQEIEHMLATICRLGRAFGIHVIAGLQRPSADVLNGQIKSQMDLRLCGRSDDTLSMIVLDTTDASRKIGKQERGRFVTNDGKLIQGFYFTDDDLKFYEV